MCRVSWDTRTAMVKSFDCALHCDPSKSDSGSDNSSNTYNSIICQQGLVLTIQKGYETMLSAERPLRCNMSPARGVQRQTAVTAYFSSEQLLLFACCTRRYRVVPCRRAKYPCMRWCTRANGVCQQTHCVAWSINPCPARPGYIRF